MTTLSALYPQRHRASDLRAALDKHVPGWREMDRDALHTIINAEHPEDHPTTPGSLAFVAGYGRGVVAGDLDEAVSQ